MRLTAPPSEDPIHPDFVSYPERSTGQAPGLAGIFEKLTARAFAQPRESYTLPIVTVGGEIIETIAWRDKA